MDKYFEHVEILCTTTRKTLRKLTAKLCVHLPITHHYSAKLTLSHLLFPPFSPTFPQISLPCATPIFSTISTPPTTITTKYFNKANNQRRFICK